MVIDDLWVYRSDLLFYARSRVSDPEEAQDLVSETYAAALSTLSSFDGVLPRAWLYALLRHRIGNAAARLRVRRSLVGPVSGTVPDAADEALGSVAVAQCLASLSPALSAVMRAVYVDGLSYAEAASALGISRGILNYRVSSARNQLRACLRRDDWC